MVLLSSLCLLSSVALTTAIHVPQPHIPLPTPPPLLKPRDPQTAINANNAANAGRIAGQNGRRQDQEEDSEGGEPPGTNDGDCGAFCHEIGGETSTSEPATSDTSDDHDDGNAYEPPTRRDADILSAEQSYLDMLSTRQGSQWLRYVPEPTPTQLLAAVESPNKAIVTPLAALEGEGRRASRYVHSVISRQTRIAARVSASEKAGGSSGESDASGADGANFAREDASTDASSDNDNDDGGSGIRSDSSVGSSSGASSASTGAAHVVGTGWRMASAAIVLGVVGGFGYLL